MKVAIVTAFPGDPAAPRGGVESVSVNLVAALARQEDLELHVVTADPASRAPTTSREDGVFVHRLPRGRSRTLAHAVGAGRRAVRGALAAIEPDVVHAHDVYGLMVKGLAVPRVFTIHGFIHADTRVSGLRLASLRSLLWRWIETAGWADQPHIISISPYVRERLAGIARGVIHDIDNPIAETFFGIERREEPGTIFSAALICARKNTLGLVEGFARLGARGAAAGARLRLAGPVTEEGYGLRVRERIAALGLGERVQLLGAIDREGVRRELSRASVFALTSLEEGSPMGIEEAMAAGVPVVASNRCGMPYLIRDGETGYLVDPLDPEDVAWRLGALLDSAALRDEMGERGRAVARDRFHPDVVARRTREVYEQAVRGREGVREHAHA